jgi:hypothetical protein
VSRLVIEAGKPSTIQLSTGLDKVSPLSIGEFTDNSTFPRTDIGLSWWGDVAHNVHDAAKLPLAPGLSDHR